jgi:hypothetical protein
LDELIIKVSREMRAREVDTRDASYQAVLEKEQLLKENDLLKKQLYGERQEKDSLEHIEGDLVHRLQSNEA